jgi:hypothetical protein
MHSPPFEFGVGRAIHLRGTHAMKPIVVLVHGAFAESSSWDDMVRGASHVLGMTLHRETAELIRKAARATELVEA